MNYTLIQGNSLERLKDLEDNSVDSIVTDPPYELGFMGKSWDKSGIAYNKELWQECLRVLKPGGFLLSFSGTRTYHRMTCAIEDAGFEIRDQIQWLYGSGFPKSTDISKQIDKDNGKKANLRKFALWFNEVSKEKTNKEIDLYLGLKSNGATASHYRCVNGEQPRFPKLDLYYKLKDWFDFGDYWDEIIKEAEREVVGKANWTTPVNGFMPDGKDKSERKILDITKPSTPEAQKWQGWGTALKPANEPICVARKPFKTTVAENVLKYGVGAMNIDESRVGNELMKQQKSGKTSRAYQSEKTTTADGLCNQSIGRWPANVIHDGLQEEWARYFYCAKASKKDRGENNNHPTVKPTDLMAYLVKLVTPPNGTVLDPFNGSGSTGKACARLGFNYIGIDLSQEYLDISKARIEHELNKGVK